MTCRTFTLLVFTLAAQSASACSIPVFRYALEHWRPDPFMVVVFHREELSDDQIALLDKLASRDPQGRPSANVMVKAIDVDDETDPALLKLWELQESTTLPWMAVHAPARSGPPQRIWAGQFNTDAIDRLLDSPARAQIAERILAGDSVVWVYLETGDPQVDEPAFQRLTTRLAELEATMRLPEIEAADFGDLSVVPEALRQSFSALRLARDAPEESQFVTMLAHATRGIEGDELPHVPIAVPVFGRGRAYDGLAGERLTPQSIEDACRFLTGACQCTVKAQNPGLDLLMRVSWDDRIQPVDREGDAPPPLVGLDDFAPADSRPAADRAADAEIAVDAPAAVASTSPPPTVAPDADGPPLHRALPVSADRSSSSAVPLGRITLIVFGALLIAVTMGTLIVMFRGK
jgi:hypothetical protein